MGAVYDKEIGDDNESDVPLGARVCCALEYGGLRRRIEQPGPWHDERTSNPRHHWLFDG
jgi:hypothetical protein